MSKLCTSIEESKRLVELGLAPETADMFWEVDKNCLGVKAYNLVPGIRWSQEELKKMFEDDAELIPAWSLGGLLCLLPFPELWQEMVGGMIGWRCKMTFMEDDTEFTSQFHEYEIDAVLECVEKLYK